MEVSYALIDDLVEKVIQSYEDYNLKKSYIYTPEGIEHIKRVVEGDVWVFKMFDKSYKIPQREKNSK